MVASPSDDALARYLQQMGAATYDQIEAARAAQRQSTDEGNPIPLGDILILQNVITPIQRENFERKIRTLRTGVQMLAHYKLIKTLGEGGMGTVYLAEDTIAQRKVAIKVLPPESATNTEFIQRFRREAQATGKLNHANIIAAYSVGEEMGHHYFVMEYCPGESLDMRLKAQKYLAWDRGVEIAIQVATGLQYAHEHGLLHRDIKPGNILLTNDGMAKILDMGLSKNLMDREQQFNTQSGVAVGTPHYISPEQASGMKEIDGRTDIYSLGATLYHLVTGHTPFEGATSAIVMMKHIGDELPNPQDLRSNIPDAIVQIIQRMMAKDPADRYADCTALVEDLKLALEGRLPVQPMLAEGKSSIAKRKEAPMPIRVSAPQDPVKGTRRQVPVRAGTRRQDPIEAVVERIPTVLERPVERSAERSAERVPAARVRKPDQTPIWWMVAVVAIVAGVVAVWVINRTDRTPVAALAKREPTPPEPNAADGAATPVSTPPPTEGEPEEAPGAPRSRPAGPPPLDAFVFNGHSYKLFVPQTTWADAKRICAFEGGHLATPTTSEETKLLVKWMEKAGVQHAHIGLSDLAGKGRWEWVTGEEFTYKGWMQGEPNKIGQETVGEIWIMASARKGWNNTTTWAKAAFFCEWDSVPSSAEIPALTANADWSKAVDLLANAEASRAAAGTWKRTEAGLVSDKTQARFEFNYQPPAEYDFMISFTRQEGFRDVVQILSGYNTSFAWCVAAGNNQLCGFSLVGKRTLEDSLTTVARASALVNGKRCVSLIQVRRKSVTAFIDGVLVSHLTRPTDLSPPEWWKLNDPAALGIGSFQSPTLFHEAKVLELSGNGVSTAP